MNDAQQTYEIQQVLAPGYPESWKITLLADRRGGGALLRIVGPTGKGAELFLTPKQVRQLVAALNDIQP